MTKLYLSILLFAISGRAMTQFDKKANPTSTSEIIVDKTLNISTIAEVGTLYYNDENLLFDPRPLSYFVDPILKAGTINEKGLPIYIQGKIPYDNARQNIQQVAYDYIQRSRPLMQIQDEFLDFEYVKTLDDHQLGGYHLIFQQLFKGIPIYGAEIIVHGDRTALDYLNGSYISTCQVNNVEPHISIDEAIKICHKDLLHVQTNDNTPLKLFTKLPQKVDLFVYTHNDENYLAYRVSTYKNIAERWIYFVDAHNKEVIHKYKDICMFHQPLEVTHISKLNTVDGKTTANALDLFNQTRNINTYQVGNRYYMIDAARDIFLNSSILPDDPNGVIWTIDAFNTSPALSNFNYDHVTSSDNTWGQKGAVSAHYNGGKAFEYYRNVHNRLSINGQKGNIISLVNVAEEDGGGMDNAFWNGLAMFYGNGRNSFLPLARGLDVAGHEMTHGVIEASANLNYQGESGAMNESFADVFGAMIDRDDWLIGEDVVRTSSFPSGALRSLIDPHNGASTNDFNKGWQPKHYNERYQGNEDNGGVHINSGIPNHAFYLFANAVGKDKAEKIYYRALTNYLTKSAQFIDLRVAVEKSALDLYTQAEVNAAKSAFDAVGIGASSGGNYEVDINENPGQSYVITTDANNIGLFIFDESGVNLGQLSSKEVYSKPSITDDGSTIIFVGTDRHIHQIRINWSINPVQVSEETLSNSPVWRNAIIAKDGSKIAAVTEQANNIITVFNLGTTVTSVDFELYNPTYSAGVITGDVVYSDAMEFDLSGEYIMYDAKNQLKSTNSTADITYWDISFIKVWNNATKTFSLGQIEKLFNGLPNDISVGNPTFSKNSPYIVAFDYIDENGDVVILGANIERGDVGVIYENNTLGFPNFSAKDDFVLFDNEGQTGLNIGIAPMSPDKIESNDTPFLFIPNNRWATWLSNGTRILSSIEKVYKSDQGIISIVPNPVLDNQFKIISPYIANTNIVNIAIETLSGQRVLINEIIDANEGELVVTCDDLPAGMYIVVLHFEDHWIKTKLVKL